MQIQDVLKPYEDSQPQHIQISSSLRNRIERIPMIVDPSTGQVTKKFQDFYDRIVDAIVTAPTWFDLYSISDQVLTEKEFISLFESKCGKIWTQFVNTLYAAKGIDIELNLSRFQKTHRNLIGGFYVIIYMIEDISNDIDESKVTSLKQYKTEILFTYKNDEFKILSILSPFVEEDSLV